MRRMVWLGVGAVLGIAGYRRLDRAAKSLTGQLESGPVTRQAVQVGRLQEQSAVSSGLRTSAGLALSLATGIVRQAGALRARRAARAGLRSGGDRRASIGTFLGDVREGMDEYLDAHAGQVQTRPRQEIG
ncbi:MAG TPA: hypothetical protein VFI65_32560 [Streptosporangiaceae bacterium]|nr:hypothetical protein [Streptosporangiaceae bacterium]